MTEEQKNKIKKITMYSYESIMDMTEKQFFNTITPLIPKGTLNGKQYDWLVEERNYYDLDENTKEILNIFNGRLIRE